MSNRRHIIYKRILVPVDGSDTSGQGLSEALHLAGDQNAELQILHINDLGFTHRNYEGLVNLAELERSAHEAAEKVLNDAKALATANGIDAELKLLETEMGEVAKVIVEEAIRWHADLIVMGTHGRRGLKHMLLGSEAEGVVRMAPVPVLLVRGS